MTYPVRIHHLKAMAKSPAHARYAYECDRMGLEAEADTPYLRLGRLAHSIALGTDLPAVFPGDRRGTKAWDQFVLDHPGVEIVKQSEYDDANAMAMAICANPEARELLTGEREKPILFESSGRACRATPDVHKVGVHLTELKTTSDASPERFPWTALRLGYFPQLAMQLDGIKAKGLPKPKRVAIVAIEVKPPYAICVYDLTPGAEEFGRRQWRLWFERFLVCEQSDSWPAYGPGVLEPPPEQEPLVMADGEEIY